MALKLYGGARSRASIVKWYLEELGLPYEFVQLNMQAGEHRQPAYLAINPFGKVPAIVEDGFVLWESGAILLYLFDRHDTGLTAEQRAWVAQWVLFANSTLSTGLFVETVRDAETPRLLSGLESQLATREWLVGDRLTAADIAVGSILGYATLMLKQDYADYPAIAAYLKRLGDRPPFQRTIMGRG
ncbi:glutathione S-transferase family protein [Thermoleptolyngbya sp. M55_K2018_002]|uniref:glutathione S-transferase family protein n=1 Tax=Thermoleptolyngbya sp. M55_K2018_002 TaxID=2747808 RepID=UPI0019D9529F|nr:glutathione S-transferase family protein [Thermoleptolyngbya sp. M55_K2018_002]HIK41819.1 glutathione S-transferase family protein [Thermoleptolyngbya sp. M55_K2018_002]